MSVATHADCLISFVSSAETLAQRAMWTFHVQRPKRNCTAILAILLLNNKCNGNVAINVGLDAANTLVNELLP